MKDSMIFYRSFHDAIEKAKKKMSKKELFLLYDCIFSAGFLMENPEVLQEKLKSFPVAEIIFISILPQISANNKKYTDGVKGSIFGHLGSDFGKKGGRPKNPPVGGKNNPPYNPPNENENENVNENVNENEISENQNTYNPEKPLDFPKLKKLCLDDQQWVEATCMGLQIRPEDLPRRLDQFNQKLTATGSPRQRTLQDFKKYFYNSEKYNIGNQNPDQSETRRVKKLLV